jgi:cell shape-determining protein MreD
MVTVIHMFFFSISVTITADSKRVSRTQVSTQSTLQNTALQINSICVLISNVVVYKYQLVYPSFLSQALVPAS